MIIKKQIFTHRTTLRCGLIPVILIVLLTVFSTLAFGNKLRVYAELGGDAVFYGERDLTGSAVELVQEIMKRTGSSTDILVVPWAVGYDALSNKANIALIPTSRTKEREELFHWVGPILRLSWQFLSHQSSSIEINSLDDARKVNGIGTYKDDAREQHLKKLGFTNIKSSISSKVNYRKLARGRIDLVYGSSAGLRTTLEMAGVNPNEVKVAYLVRSMDTYIAISKETDPKIVQQWKDALQAIREDGTFERIYEKWYPGDPAPLEELQP